MPADAPTSQQVAQAIATAGAKIGGENGTTGSAVSQGKVLYRIAEGYAKQAEAACSAAGG